MVQELADRFAGQFPPGNFAVFFHEGDNKRSPGTDDAERLPERTGHILHETDDRHHQDAVEYPGPVWQEFSHAQDRFYPPLPGHREHSG